jgi:shikimate kinase
VDDRVKGLRNVLGDEGNMWTGNKMMVDRSDSMENSVVSTSGCAKAKLAIMKVGDSEMVKVFVDITLNKLGQDGKDRNRTEINDRERIRTFGDTCDTGIF